MDEETCWTYPSTRPDLVEEIITNQRQSFDPVTRTIRLIELVAFGEKVTNSPL